jgi:hypothetical protein
MSAAPRARVCLETEFNSAREMLPAHGGDARRLPTVQRAFARRKRLSD